jgi:hypothetical protein
MPPRPSKPSPAVETKADAAEQDASLVTARDSYFMAAIHWEAAQWPIDGNNEQNRFYNDKKRECYTKYAKVADHQVEAAWVKLPGGQSLPGWFHLPPGYRGGRLPVVISLPGMDSFKEMGVALNGDRWLSRGMAVLALDGPGQYESPVLEIYFSMEAWIATGTAAVDWLTARRARSRREPHRARRQQLPVVLRNHCRRPRAADSRRRGSPLSATSGFHTIFEEASPTFKIALHVYVSITDGPSSTAPQGRDLGGARRHDPRAVPLSRRRSRGALPHSSTPSG